MPGGGGDIGMNIWVEKGDIMFYVSRSGTFDENNCLLKQGRIPVSYTHLDVYKRQINNLLPAGI